MTDAELIAMARLAQRDERMSTGALYGDLADRIEALIAERERLALAICGGEDAPGYANDQTVEALEKVARDNHNVTMEQINRTLALETKLAKAADMMSSLIAMIQHAIGPGKDVFIEPDTGRKLSDARATLAELTGGKDE